MPFPFDKYPWLNFQELNLAYFIKHFREIFEQWDTLLHEMYDWKDATDAELAEWKSTVETGISSWETGLQQSMEDWKDATEADISEWEGATLTALDAWKTATTAVFEQIRTEAAASATAAAGSAASAQTALAGAQAAQAAAETAAAGIQSELSQIQTNTADIADLKTQIDNLNDIIYPNIDTIVTYQENYALDATFKNFPFGVALTPNNEYRIFIKFDVIPQTLSSIQTATGAGGTSIVDNITSDFVGDSWTEGKTCIYTPTVENIINLRIQFISSYTGTYKADIYVYDHTKEKETSIDEINANIEELDNKIDGVENALSADIETLDEKINNINDLLYPNDPINVISEENYSLPNIANYISINQALLVNHKYRIYVKFINSVTGMTSIRTSTGTSSSGFVDDITTDFNGDSWTDGKIAEYIPIVNGIKYIAITFNSAYTGNINIDIVIDDITYINNSEFDNIDEEFSDVSNDIKDLHSVQNIIDLESPYNLLPPDGYVTNKAVDRATGELATSAGKVASDYIEIDPAQGYICNNTKTSSITYDPITGTSDSGNFFGFDRFAYAFYDKDKVYIPYTSGADATSKIIPSNAKYIRVTVVSEQIYPLARLIYGNYQDAPIVRIVQYKKIPPKSYIKPSTGFENFKMVMFGDSITHGSLSVGNDGTSYTDYASDYLNSNIVNVGFGGTRATYTLSGAGLFCFYHLCECIVSSDPSVWDDLVAHATNENQTYLPHLQKLMNMDWENVNAIGLMYGANDFTSNTPVGSDYNETVSNYDGAIAYGIKLLVQKYPHLQVLILAPFDRMRDPTDPDTMTDTTPNTAGLYMYDYADSLKPVSKHFHCPLIITNELFQMDEYRILLYASDGTHPRSNIAQFRLGWLFAECVRTKLSPI